ncbi:MAG: hypothetical protein AAGC65_21460 [Mucilaginibacter sp.]|uniref:hypothetical protein n=1 Tax=Mucilaginibacter sp. TaxID=1882438 RepID=UPI0031A9CE1A
MSENIIKYRDWIFEMDKIQTEKVYQNVQVSGTESCTCGNCKYFDIESDRIFPDEIKLLFMNLGVDINKNFEVTDYGDEKTQHVYMGEFHFIGNIIEGNDCSILFKNGGYYAELVPITKSFSIGFTKRVSQSFFNKERDLIQIEFTAKVPLNL